MAIADVPEPRRPGPGEAVVRPEAVGICGSDFHLFSASWGLCSRASRGTRSAQSSTRSGRVARACGRATASRSGRCSRAASATCARSVAATPARESGSSACTWTARSRNAFCCLRRSSGWRPGAGSRRARRARLDRVRTASRAGSTRRRVVVLGAGPIGQGVTLAAGDRGASVLLVDRIARPTRARRAAWCRRPRGRRRRRSGRGGPRLVGWRGPPVVVDATGSAKLIQAAVHAVATAAASWSSASRRSSRWRSARSSSVSSTCWA